ncbi:aminodeoxychorismate synthase component I, partial [Thermodesulfobacteriota bacterium]
MIIKEINKLSAINCFMNLREDDYPFFLDSSVSYETLGRYSFVGSAPFLTFSSYDDEITITKKGLAPEKFKGNPFTKFQELLDKFKREKSEFPFASGAVGYFSYDMGRHIEKLSQSAKEDVSLPHSFFGFYDTLFMHDNHLGKSFVVHDDALLGEGDGERKVDIFTEKISRVFGSNNDSNKESVKTPSNGGDRLNFESNFSREAYLKGIEKVLEYISNGDIYQANLSQRFSVDYSGDVMEFYKSFVEISPAPFGALLDIKDAVIMSNSPERYLKKVGDHIETRPIKGTRKRSSDADEDNRLVEELKKSEKDLAEHLMIVDLERNDLGRVSKFGSVNVDDFIVVESYSNVHHLVSTVSGRLVDGVTPIECIMNSFPGGSITGAPKIRSMEIIDEIEPTTRGIYTGAIGYFDLSGDFDFNIAIRTAIYYKGDNQKGKIYFQVGGGIVADSDPSSEYEETIV